MTLRGSFYSGTFFGGPRDGAPHKAPTPTDIVLFEELDNCYIPLTWVSGKWVPTNGKWHNKLDEGEYNDITYTDQD